ncbi:hypothetical protein GS682_00795 [Nostoc sp. B(2019)]|nr:hypothetical protein [Nostoc sp. B(2019)]
MFRNRPSDFPQTNINTVIEEPCSANCAIAMSHNWRYGALVFFSMSGNSINVMKS